MVSISHTTCTCIFFPRHVTCNVYFVLPNLPPLWTYLAKITYNPSSFSYAIFTTPSYFVRFEPKYFPSSPFSNAFTLCLSLNMKVRLHAHKKQEAKLRVLCFLILDGNKKYFAPNYRSILRISFPFNFFLNAILICCCYDQIFEFVNISKD